MDRARLGGAVICLLTVVLGAAYLVGLVVERWRFWALAIPVTVSVAVVLVLGFWIGFTIATTDTNYPSPALPQENAPAAPSEQSASSAT